MTDYYESITSKIRARALLGMPILGEVFDSWLAEVESAAAKRAWDEGQQAQFEAIVTRGVTIDLSVNPYRESEARND